MPIRYVIRPQSIRTTPRLLANAFNAQTFRWPNRRSTLPNWEQDFFLVYPRPSQVLHCTDEYDVIWNVGRATKPVQRAYLSSHGVPVPLVFNHQQLGPYIGRWIVRPLRHSQGVGYRITEDPYDHDPQVEYVQRLYPKRFEYRIIFCLGTPLITLLKRVPDDIDPDGPWNHSNGSYFVTVHDINNNRLRHTDVYDRLLAVDVIKHAHLVAADILLGDGNDFVVTEINFAPALTIESNLQKVVQHVQASR